MVRFKKIDPEIINSKIRIIRGIFKKYSREVIRAYLYGSFAVGHAGPLSDIDIAVLFHRQITSNTLTSCENTLTIELIDYFGTDEIDLTVLNREFINALV